jgi:hypothetical protein
MVLSEPIKYTLHQNVKVATIQRIYFCMFLGKQISTVYNFGTHCSWNIVSVLHGLWTRSLYTLQHISSLISCQLYCLFTCPLVTCQILLFWIVLWVSFVRNSFKKHFRYPTSMQSRIWIYYCGILNSLFHVVCSVSIRLLCVLPLALLCPYLSHRVRRTWCCLSTLSKFYITSLRYPMVLCVSLCFGWICWWSEKIKIRHV